MLRWLLLPYMAWTSRICGGAPPPVPRPFDVILFAAPLGIVCLHADLWAILAFVGAFLGKSTGHGQYMSLNNYLKKVHAERLDFIVAWFWGQDPRVVATDDDQAVILSEQYGLTKLYWRCVTGLIVVGLAVTIAPGIIFAATMSAQGGILLLLSGALMSLAYMIGWWIYPDYKGKGPPNLDESTEVGEFLMGLFIGIALAIIWPF